MQEAHLYKVLLERFKHRPQWTDQKSSSPVELGTLCRILRPTVPIRRLQGHITAELYSHSNFILGGKSHLT